MKNYLNDKEFVSKWAPYFSMILLEGANVSQILRMWTERTAQGQSLMGWSAVWLALVMWLNFYRVNEQRSAIITTAIGVGLNTCVILSVVYFRYIV